VSGRAETFNTGVRNVDTVAWKTGLLGGQRINAESKVGYKSRTTVDFGSFGKKPNIEVTGNTSYQLTRDAISIVNNRFARFVGKSLGVAGFGFDAAATVSQINKQISAGNLSGAGLSAAQFVGRQGGGFALGAASGIGGTLAGAALFGEAGALAGTVAPGVGNIIGGFLGGLVGGVVGAVAGEAAITSLYNSIIGLPLQAEQPQPPSSAAASGPFLPSPPPDWGPTHFVEAPAPIAFPDEPASRGPQGSPNPSSAESRPGGTAYMWVQTGVDPNTGIPWGKLVPVGDGSPSASGANANQSPNSSNQQPNSAPDQLVGGFPSGWGGARIVLDPRPIGSGAWWGQDLEATPPNAIFPAGITDSPLGFMAGVPTYPLLQRNEVATTSIWGSFAPVPYLPVDGAAPGLNWNGGWFSTAVSGISGAQAGGAPADLVAGSFTALPGPGRIGDGNGIGNNFGQGDVWQNGTSGIGFIPATTPGQIGDGNGIGNWWANLNLLGGPAGAGAIGSGGGSGGDIWQNGTAPIGFTPAATPGISGIGGISPDISLPSPTDLPQQFSLGSLDLSTLGADGSVNVTSLGSSINFQPQIDFGSLLTDFSNFVDVFDSSSLFAGFDPFGGDANTPVVLDLTGNGINITQLSSSNTFIDATGGGLQNRTAWAGAGNGVLVFDPTGSTVITSPTQFNFTLWDPAAATDMQALEAVFDTNHDGELDAGDAAFSSFGVLVTNADGTTSFETLSQLGITAINLTTNNNSQALPDGSQISGETTYTKADGSTGTAADVSFVYDPNGFVTKTVTTHNSDGSTTIDVKGFNPDGSLANETVSSISTNGLSRTVQFDHTGDGVFDQTQTDVTVVNADGSKTETLSDFNAIGILTDRTVTTTSADGKAVTIARDLDGSGITGQLEVHTTNADGSHSVSVSDLSANGAVEHRTVTTTSADGLTKTVQTDSTGSGVFDRTETDVIVVNADRSRTETVSDLNADGSLVDRTVTQTSADGRTKTIARDLDGNGSIDLTTSSTMVTGADGSVATTLQEFNGDGSLRDATVTTLSADGLSKTVQSDQTGNGTFDLTTSDVTADHADGSRTETVTDRNADGSLRDQTVTTTSADGRTRSISADTTGNGVIDHTEAVTVDAGGDSVDTVSDTNADGSLKDRTVTTTSADGRTSTVAIDSTGNGTVDLTRIQATVINSAGSSVSTATELNADGSLRDRTVVTTSADRRTVTTQWDHAGSGTFDETRTDVSVLNADGSTTETVTDVNADGSLRELTVTTTSADRRTVTIDIDSTGNGAFDRIATAVTQANGSKVDTVSDYNADGSLKDQAVITTSASGLSVTTQADATGNGVFDATRTDVTVINANGSRTKTVTDTSANGTLIDQTVTTTSANGLSITTQADPTGDGVFDLTTADVTAINANGSKTETVTDLSANGTLIDQSVTTTSANGLSITTQTDSTGNGSFDQTRTDVTVRNADGSKTETVTDSSANGTLIDQTVTTTSANALSQTIDTDSTGNGQFDQVETITTSANGSKVDTVSDTNADGSLRDQQVTTISANGLSVTTQTDTTGDGTFDQTQTDVTVLNANGSTTETVTDLSANGTLIDQTVTTTSASGLSITTQTDQTGNGTFDLTTTDVTVLNANGSTTETVTDTSTNGTLLDQTVTTTSASGLSRTIDTDSTGNGKFDRIETITTSDNGSKVDTVADTNADGSLKDQTITTKSANGLSVTTQTDSTGNGSFDRTRTDVTVLNANGSTTETVTDLSGNGTLIDQAVKTTSSSGLSVTTQADPTGDGIFDLTKTDVTAINANGSKTETVTDLSANGTLIDQSVTTTSANGLSVTTQSDLTGNGKFDLTRTDVTVLNADGSKTETVTDSSADGALLDQAVTTTSASGLNVTVDTDSTGAANAAGNAIFDEVSTTATQANGSVVKTVSDYNADGSLRDQAVATTSANGLSVTTQTDSTGDGTFDQIQTDVTVLNANGASTETVTDLSANGTLIDQSVTTTSANGLSITTQADQTGNGSFDLTTTDVTVLNANGSTTETVTDTSTNGTLLDQTVTTTSANGLSQTINTDSTGNGKFDRIETITTSANGSKVDTVSDYNADGSLRDQTVTTTSANGLSITTQTDSTGNGRFDRIRTDVTVLNANGSTTETVTDLSANGTLIDQAVRTTSASGLSVTTQTDQTGNGTFDLTTTDVTAINANGSKTETVTDLSANGTLLDQTVITTSANGLSRTTQVDSTGNGSFDRTRTDVKVLNADGSTTETVTDTSANGTREHQTVTTTSASGLSRTIDTDSTGNGQFDHVETITTSANGSKVDTVSDYHASGSLEDQKVTTTSANGLSKTTQVNSTGGTTFDRTETDVTALGADGSKTETVTDTSANGTLLDQTVTTTSANGLSVKTQTDSTGNGTFDHIRTGAVVLHADGSTTATVTDTCASGTVLDQTVTTTSANRLSQTIQTDSTGDGRFDRVETITTAANGGKVDDVQVVAPNGALISETLTLTSADGLEKTETTNIDGKVDFTTTDMTVRNIDGSSTETVTKRANDGALISQTTTRTSANGFSSTTTTSLDGKVDATVADVTTIATSGNRTEVITSYDPQGAKIDATQITTAANGLLKTTLVDENGDGSFDIQATDQRSLNSDGSVTELVTTTTVGASPVTLGRTQTSTSANGLTVTTSVDHTGDGVYDAVTTDVKDPVGDDVTTVVHDDPNGNKISATVTTTHANGLFTEIQTDLNGDGTFDRTEIDSTVLNPDGSRTETVTNLAGTTTVATTVTTTSGNGTTVTTQKYIDGTAATGTLVETDHSKATYNSDGTVTETSTVKNQSSVTIEASTTQISADRRTTTITTNYLPTSFGAGQTDAPASSLETRSVLGDGSLEDTIDYYASPSASGPHLASKTTLTSANGLSKTVSWDLNGDGASDDTQSDVTTIGADGSTTETFTASAAFPGTSFAEGVAVTAVTSGNGLTSSVSASINLGEELSVVDGARAESINPDGSTVVVTTDSVSLSHRASASAGYAHVYSGSDAAVVTTSRDGLTKTTQISTWGNNTFYRTDSLTTHLGGSTTETITNLNDDNSVGEAETVNTSADGRTISVTDQTDEHGLIDYLVQSTVPTNDGSGNAVSLTTTSNYTANGGTLLSRETQSTQLNGLSKTTTLDTLGNGTVDETKTDVTVFSPDGKTIQTITETDASGSQIKQEVVTTSADGLHKTVTIAGSGAVLATTQSDTVHNADGSTTTTAITTSPGAGIRNETVINTSADGRVTNVTWDLNGAGVTSATETSVTNASGAKTVTDTYYDPDGVTVSSVVTTTTTADGLMTTVNRAIAVSPSSNTTETTIYSADGSGSYSWTELDASGNQLVYADHTIDQNGIDSIDLWVRGTEVLYKISAAQEAQDLDQVQSLYAVLLGRTMSPQETQTWLKYYTNGGLNVMQLADDIMSSAEFWQDDGAPNWDPTVFINAVYENAFGRLPNAVELQFWSNKIIAAEPPGDPNPAIDYGSLRASFAVEMARIANPAGVANVQFNLQAASPYPLPFGAGGGGGGGVPDSITTFSNTQGTVIENFDPVTGFLQRTEYYSGSLNYLTDYYNGATGQISSEYGYYYDQSGTKITVAYIASGNTITLYAPVAFPNNLFSYANTVLGITNNPNGTSTWSYEKSGGGNGVNFTWGTVVYSGSTTINRFSGLNVGGQLVSSDIEDLSTGNRTTKFLSGTEYLVVEYNSSNARIAAGFDGPGFSEITYYNPSRFRYDASVVSSLELETTGPDTSGVVTTAYYQTIYGTFFDQFDSAGNFTQTFRSNYGGVVTTTYAANGTYLSGDAGQPLGVPAGYYFYGNGIFDPNAIAINGAYFGAGLGGGSYGSPLASELPGVAFATNTTIAFATPPGTGSATGSSNTPTTPAGGFTFTAPALNPTSHIIDTKAGFVSGTGEDTFIYNAGYGSVEIDEDDPSAAAQNVLQLGSTIRPSSVGVTADSSGNLYITDGTAGDVIELAAMLSDPTRGVQSVQFTSNNTTWTRAQLIAAVVYGPTLSVQNASGADGEPIALSIDAAANASEASASLSITIAGLPSGASLSAGTLNADGSWTLTPAQLSGLALTVPVGSFAGTAELTVTATAAEPDGTQQSTRADLAVVIAGVATAPTLAVQSASGNAGMAIALDIASALTATDGTESLSIEVTGVPGAATLSAGTRNADGNWTLTPAQLSGLTLTAPAGSFAGTANLTVTATATEADGSIASTSATLPVTIAGVAARPILSAQPASGHAGTAIALSITSGLAATDGTESLSIQITGVPSGATLSAGTLNADGSWTLTPAQLTSLSLNAPAAGSFAGTANLTVTATATETDGSVASTSAALPVAIAGVATAPTLSVQGASGNAGTAIALTIASALTATDGTENLVVKIAGLPVGASLSAGTHNSDGSWTLTPAQLTGLTLTAPVGSFAGTANLTVTATATETDGSAASTSAALPVAIAGVASAPTLSVQGASGNAGTAIALTIASALTATDGTENLAVKIIGLPSGASLSAGTHNSDGSWTLTPAQLTGLTLTAPAGSFAGTANLTVTATATETDGSAVSTSAALPVAIAGVATAPTLSLQGVSGNAGTVIALNIASALTATDGTESLSIKIAGLPSGASLSAGTHNSDGSWTLTPAQLSGLVLTTATGVFGTFNLAVTATALETDGSQASNAASLPVTITGLASIPTLSVQNASGNAGTTIALNIASALTSQDGHETLSVKIAGVPGAATLSAGTRNADGSWTLTPAQLANLSLLAPAGSFAGTASLTVTSTATDSLDGSTASTSANLPVAITGVASTPTLSVQGASGNAGTAIALNIASALTATDGQESLSVTVTGVPGVATLSAGTRNADGSWTLTPAQLTGLSLSVPAGSFASTANLTVTSTATETDGSSATVSAGFTVAIAGVATAPSLSVQSASGNAGTTIPLSITSALTATDGQETLSVRITGVPAAATLSAGTRNADGSWTLTASQLSGLSLNTAAGGFAGTANLTVTSTATESDGSTALISASLPLTIAGVATAPSLSVQSASGNAGSAIALNIASALTATDGAESLSIKITGLPSAASLSAGTKNADGSWTLTPAQLTGLSLSVPAGSFAGSANLTVTSTATETDGSSATASAGFTVAIAGVASAPTLHVQSASGNAGTTIPLSITSALTATDGQETLSVRITGVPAAATLSAGTRNADGSWTLTASQLSGLSLSTPAGGFAGTANLMVTSTATESDGSTASTSASLPLTIAGVATAPSLSVQSASGNAGSAIALNIASALTATDGAESLSIKITGLPSAASLSAGTKNADGSWTLTPAQLTGLSLSVPAGSFAGTANLTVTSTATETDGSTAVTAATLSLAIAGVATAPTLSVQNASGLANTAIALSISSAITATDGTERLSLTITGVPSGATLSAGSKNADGSWTLGPTQLSGLSFTAPTGTSGNFNLTVTSTAIETDGSQASSSANLSLAISAAPSQVLSTSGTNVVLQGGAGNDTLTSTGSLDTLIGGSGTTTLISDVAENTLIAGSGLTIASYTGSRLTVDLSANMTMHYADTDTLVGITVASIAGGQANTLIAGSGKDTLSSNGVNDRLIAGSGAAEVLSSSGYFDVLIGGSGADTLSSTGSNNTLVAGSGMDTLWSSGSADTLIAGSGTTTIVDTGTASFIQFGVGDAAANIINGSSANSTASNELDMGAGISDEQLWFVRSGNNLQIDVMGSQGQVTVSNWFASTGNQLSEITAGGLKLDSQLSQLVQAMATYSAANPGFNPTAVSQAPNNAALQGAIAAAWHS
jgi:hypothetical protein